MESASADGGEGACASWQEIIDEREISAVSGVGVDSEFVFVAQLHDFVKRVDGAGGGSAHGDHDGGDATLVSRRFSRALKLHAAVRVALDSFERQL